MLFRLLARSVSQWSPRGGRALVLPSLLVCAVVFAVMGCQGAPAGEGWESQAAVNEQVLGELAEIREQLRLLQPDAALTRRVMGGSFDGDFASLERELNAAGYTDVAHLMERMRAMEDDLAAGEALRQELAELTERNEALKLELVRAAAQAEAGGGAPLNLPAVAEEPGEARVLDLPAAASEAVWAGGGRYLLLLLDGLNQIAVVDIEQEAVKGYLRVPGDNALVAAGLTKVFIVLPDEGLIQRWSLETLERETVRQLPYEGKTTAAVMGWASEGPLMLRYGGERHRGGGMVFLDTDRLEPIGVEPAGGQRFEVSPGNIRVSADGRVFGGWRTGVSPSGGSVLTVDGDQYTTRYEHNSLGHVIPSADGKLVMTRVAVFTAGLQRLGDNNDYRGAFVPSTHPNFFLSVPGNLGGGGEPDRPGSVFMGRSMRPVITLPDTPDLVEGIDPRLHPAHNYPGIAVDKRLMYNVVLDKLVTVNTSCERVTFRDFSLELELARAGIDYLLVTTDAPPTAPRGQRYTYTIDVMSNRDGVTYTLESGPEGMAVDAETGEVVWDVPADFRVDESVIILIANSGGHETYHTFTVAPAR